MDTAPRELLRRFAFYLGHRDYLSFRESTRRIWKSLGDLYDERRFRVVRWETGEKTSKRKMNVRHAKNVVLNTRMICDVYDVERLLIPSKCLRVKLHCNLRELHLHGVVWQRVWSAQEAFLVNLETLVVYGEPPNGPLDIDHPNVSRLFIAMDPKRTDYYGTVRLNLPKLRVFGIGKRFNIDYICVVDGLPETLDVLFIGGKIPFAPYGSTLKPKELHLVPKHTVGVVDLSEVEKIVVHDADLDIVRQFLDGVNEDLKRLKEVHFVVDRRFWGSLPDQFSWQNEDIKAFIHGPPDDRYPRGFTVVPIQTLEMNYCDENLIARVNRLLLQRVY